MCIHSASWAGQSSPLCINIMRTLWMLLLSIDLDNSNWQPENICTPRPLEWLVKALVGTHSCMEFMPMLRFCSCWGLKNKWDELTQARDGLCGAPKLGSPDSSLQIRQAKLQHMVCWSWELQGREFPEKLYWSNCPKACVYLLNTRLPDTALRLHIANWPPCTSCMFYS